MPTSIRAAARSSSLSEKHGEPKGMLIPCGCRPRLLSRALTAPAPRRSPGSRVEGSGLVITVLPIRFGPWW
ncbi:hypothetical protein KIPE111705_10600 [Kibdelosporangium persicum]